MALLLALYVLLIVCLTGLAIYEHLTTTTLSLPLSPFLTILTILLPLFSLLTTSLTSFSISSRRAKPLLPIISNTLQLILTIILSTLLGSSISNPFTPCALQTTWRSFWTSHDSTSIRKIQDALNCCGFKSTKDMAWPFPSGKNGGDVGSCERQFNRHTPCAGVWEGELNKTAGVELAVVIVVGLVQVVSLVLFKAQRARGGRGGKRGEWLGRVFEIFASGGNGDETTRPLLTGGRSGERYLTANRGVEDDGEENEEEDGDESRNGQADSNGYGGTTRTAHTQTQPNGDNGRAGPRVEVSHHDPWAGAERV